MTDKDSAQDLADGGAGASGPAYAAPAVDKAFEIIDLLSQEADALSIADMAARLERSASQIYRVVLALHRLGILIRDEGSDRYSLSLRLFEIATRQPVRARLVRHARPILAGLAEEIDQSCHLAVIAGTSVLIIAQEDSPMPMHYTVKLGARFPAMETSSGAAIAAHMPAHDQQALLETVAETDRAGLTARFNAIRDTGFETRPSDVTAGVINLTAPILDPAGQPLAALTVPFLPQLRMRATVDQAQAAVIAAAARLTALINQE